MQTIIDNQLWIPLIIASLILLALIGKAAEDRRKKQEEADAEEDDYDDEEEEVEEEAEEIEKLPESFEETAEEAVDITNMELPDADGEVAIPETEVLVEESQQTITTNLEEETSEPIGLGLEIPSVSTDNLNIDSLPKANSTNLEDDFGIDEIPKLITEAPDSDKNSNWNA